MNRRSFLTLMVTTSVGAAGSLTVHAQRGDMEYFAGFVGLDRVIARTWAAPVSEMAPVASPATPGLTPAASPVATPVSGGETLNLSVFIYLFDTDENAAAGFDRIDADLLDIRDSDPNAPMGDDLALDGVGDLASGYMGTLEHGASSLTFTFATVQDGPFVYGLSGTFSDDTGEDLTRSFAEALVAAPMNRMAEQFNADGTSRGGLWSKLDGLQPAMPPDSTVRDFAIYPLPEAAETTGRRPPAR